MKPSHPRYFGLHFDLHANAQVTEALVERIVRLARGLIAVTEAA